MLSFLQNKTSMRKPTSTSDEQCLTLSEKCLTRTFFTIYENGSSSDERNIRRLQLQVNAETTSDLERVFSARLSKDRNYGMEPESKYSSNDFDDVKRPQSFDEEGKELLARKKLRKRTALNK